MSISHTPGPWRVVGRDPTLENVRFGHWDVEGKSNVALSCTYHDARLIAAAPDLLASLVEILGPLNVCTDNPNVRDDQVLPVDMTMGELRRARAAISKATSRQPEGER